MGRYLVSRLSVKCTYCGAEPHTPCQGTRGPRRSVHIERWNRRLAKDPCAERQALTRTLQSIRPQQDIMDIANQARVLNAFLARILPIHHQRLLEAHKEAQQAGYLHGTRSQVAAGEKALLTAVTAVEGMCAYDRQLVTKIIKQAACSPAVELSAVVTGAPTPTLPDAVRDLVSSIQARERRLNDPHDSGTGEDARAPTGDDYNGLYSDIKAFLQTLGIAL